MGPNGHLEVIWKLTTLSSYLKGSMHHSDTTVQSFAISVSHYFNLYTLNV